MRINKNFLIYIQRIIIKNKEASISLMSAILIPAIVFMSLGIADACKIINEQLKIDRLMYLYGDYQLANYDRNLYERYGLFGFEENAELADVINENLHNENVAHKILSEVNDNLYDVKILKKQINSFSATRIPIKVFNDIKDRMQNLSSNNKKVSFESLKDSVKKIDSAIEKIGFGDEKNENIKNKDKSVKANLSDRKNNNKQSYYEHSISLMNDNYKIPQDKLEANTEADEGAIENWKDFFKSLSYAKSLNEEINGANTGESEAGFLASVIENLEKIHNLSKKDFIAPIEKFFLIEYTVNQFNSHVRGPDTANSDYLTLTGQNMSKLEFSQTHEAERILLAVENQNIAMGIINTFIYSTRVLSNYFSINNNASTMRTKRALATGISSAVALLTLGLVLIDVESIAQVLVLIDSVVNAFDDLKRIKKGESLALVGNSVKGMLNVKVDYIDYLRFLGLFRAMNKQYFVMSKMIKSNMNRDYYTKVSFVCDYKNKFWAYPKKSESSYDFEEVLQR